MWCAVFFAIKTRGDGEIRGEHAQRKEKRGEAPEARHAGSQSSARGGSPAGGGASAAV